MITIEKIGKKFGKLVVLDELNLEIGTGGIFAILGPNGSGKTTLIKSILGMVIPEKGSISIDEKQIRGEWAYRNEINYLPQIGNH